MPLNSLYFLNLKESLSIGDEFNEINGKFKCNKNESGPSTKKIKSPKERKFKEGI